MQISKSKREQIYSKYSGKCAYCGNDIDIKQMQVDHIIPKKNFLLHIKEKRKIPSFLSHLTEFDVNHIDNLMPSCNTCNNWKSAYDLEYFRSELQEQIKRLNERSSNYKIAKKYGQLIETPKPVIFYFETIK